MKPARRKGPLSWGWDPSPSPCGALRRQSLQQPAHDKPSLRLLCLSLPLRGVTRQRISPAGPWLGGTGIAGLLLLPRLAVAAYREYGQTGYRVHWSWPRNTTRRHLCPPGPWAGHYSAGRALESPPETWQWQLAGQPTRLSLIAPDDQWDEDADLARPANVDAPTVHRARRTTTDSGQPSA